MASRLTVVFLLLSLSMQAYTEEQANPVLLWSNTNTFAHQNNRKIEISTAKGLNDLIWEPMSKHFDNTNVKPEVVVIFAENSISAQESPLEKNSFEFKSNGGSFPNLKEVFEASQSSIVLPFIEQGQSISIEAIAHLANSISGNTYIVEDIDATKQTFVAQKGVILSKVQALTDSVKISSMNSEQLMNNLRDNTWAPLINHKIDLIVVGFQNTENSESKLASDDSQIKSVISALENVQYSAFFVTNIDNKKSHVRSEADDVTKHFRSVEKGHYRIRGDMDDWSDDVLEALIIMIPFIGIVLIGVVCTCKLQSDLKFDHEKNILKKQ